MGKLRCGTKGQYPYQRDDLNEYQLCTDIKICPKCKKLHTDLDLDLEPSRLSDMPPWKMTCLLGDDEGTFNFEENKDESTAFSTGDNASHNNYCPCRSPSQGYCNTGVYVGPRNDETQWSDNEEEAHFLSNHIRQHQTIAKSKPSNARQFICVKPQHLRRKPSGTGAEVSTPFRNEQHIRPARARSHSPPPLGIESKGVYVGPRSNETQWSDNEEETIFFKSPVRPLFSYPKSRTKPSCAATEISIPPRDNVEWMLSTQSKDLTPSTNTGTTTYKIVPCNSRPMAITKEPCTSPCCHGEDKHINIIHCCSKKNNCCGYHHNRMQTQHHARNEPQNVDTRNRNTTNDSDDKTDNVIYVCSKRLTPSNAEVSTAAYSECGEKSEEYRYIRCPNAEMCYETPYHHPHHVSPSRQPSGTLNLLKCPFCRKTKKEMHGTCNSVVNCRHKKRKCNFKKLCNFKK